ncbi:hypothetical protein ACFL35_08210 [Candidatus Riflebacteria bacterium]
MKIHSIGKFLFVIAILCLIPNSRARAALRGDYLEAFKAGFLYKSPIKQKIIFSRALTKTDALKIFYKLYKYLDIKIPDKYVRAIELPKKPELINSGYRNFLKHLKSQFPIGNLLDENYISNKKYLTCLKRFTRYMELKFNLHIPVQAKTGALFRNTVHFLNSKSFKNSTRTISFKDAGLYTLKIAQQIKHQKRMQEILQSGRKATMLYLDIPEDHPFNKKVSLLHQHKILGERYSRQYTLLLDETVSRNELLLVFGNLITSNGVLRKKKAACKYKKIHKSYWNQSIKRMIENKLFIRLSKKDKTGKTKVTREELVKISEKVFKFCELNLGFDPQENQCANPYEDISQNSEIYDSLKYLTNRNIIPFSGNKFHASYAVTRYEVLNMIAGFLKNCEFL